MQVVRNIRGLRRGGPGRPKGSINRATQDIREFSQAILSRPEYVQSLQERLDAGKAPHMEVLLHHYAVGKPKDTLSVEVAPPVMVVDELTVQDVEQQRRARDDA